MSPHQSRFLVFILLCLQAVEAYAEPEEPEPNKTIIEDQILSQDKLTGFRYFKEKSATQTPSDASMLFHIPGLTLTQNGGHLAGAQISYRGLSNSRLPITLEGLSLNNPINGFTDANSMFLFAASRLEANAQSLAIILPELTEPYAKGLLGFGSENSLKAGASAGAPIDDYSSMFGAMQISSTNGEFTYVSPNLPVGSDNNFRRKNNDHHRLQALSKYQRNSPTGSAHILAALNLHEGGIAGFAFSPNDNLRSQAFFSGLSAGLSKKHQGVEYGISLANSLFNYKSHDQAHNSDNLTSSIHELTLSMKPLGLPLGMDFEWGEQLLIERAYEIDQSRVGGGIILKREMKFPGHLKTKTYSNFSMMAFNQHGLVFKKDFGLSLEPSDYLILTGRYVRSQRLPTFMELYANNKFFVGNDKLNTESIWDIEFGSIFKFTNLIIQATAFMGFLNEVIVYVPFMATKSRPLNIKSASRYGLDLGFNYEPVPWLKLETQNNLLKTHLKDIKAPLPHAPLFAGLSKIRLGREESWALSLQSRYRGSSTANLAGTLKSDAYILFDAVLSAQILAKINLSLSATNILNNKRARDSYEMPLPGTMLFAQIEIGSI